MSWFELSRSEGVAHLRLARPAELNTLLPAFWDSFPSVVAGLDDGMTRALVISSTGRHFTAGLDRSVLAGGGLFGDDPGIRDLGRRRLSVHSGIRRFQEAFSVLEQVRFPVVAAIQGGCVGGGLALVSACDLRYGTRDCFFTLAETGLGITADVGQLQRLPHVMPEGVVKELAFRGLRLTASRAEQVGFLNGVYADHEAVVAASLSIAREMATHSPLALWGVKRAVSYARDHSVDDGLDHVAMWQAAVYHRSDSAESMRALEEGRRPTYEDLPPR